ncbi:hypothetical protein HHK36_023487 [Tetracentron sinense]|uniref:non-specific serine/threonine protein kinase n=1 Tax=Tetracentron sinense TaxID=13715 RepID=A0A834YQ93_TETSI|nr:hypothetical protein HHK36_023487 [Tetracentron sinense]
MESVHAISKPFSAILLVFLLFNCFGVFRSNAQLLPEDEVQTLQEISTKLKNPYWNVTTRFCSEGSSYIKTKDIFSNVTCDCSQNSSNVCHVTHILLKRLNLTGVIPEEFGNLSFLQEIDLSRNYLNGSIPSSLARLNLTILSLLGNRLSGPIPKEIGDIATLEDLNLEDNQFEGPLPEQLGNLSRLTRFLASANNFTGMLPETFVNLKNLTDFRIDGNDISGKIPDFIGNWTKLERLDMQGTSMEGPIPTTISLLKNLTDLRISDLNGSSIDFPDLQDMKNMEELVLRNCWITGSIPDYVGAMTKLKTLDLSFNTLTGVIPGTLQQLSQLVNMFLTNNSLTGAIPPWILSSQQSFDLSYNNFTEASSSSCQQANVNLVSSYSSSEDNSISWCLKKGLPCSKKPEYHSLFINCGGKKLKNDGKEYEEDSSTMGPSNFLSSERWGYSSTGVYIGNSNADYIATNTSALNTTNPGIYTTARLAPVSLKYYGLCLQRGSYTVQLHFAEIMYTEDQTFSSLGKRIFDVSIQGTRVLKDFNIVKEAKGVGIGITREFNNVSVDGSTLEIHLYWSGKGTTAIPDRGVYGPLISAITVTPNFDPHTGLSVGAIAGIVAASCVVVVSILGTLSDGGVIAVKQLSSKSKQGNREFVNEIGMISALQHPNLVKLYGCCIEGNQLLLIYEYMENNSLARALFGREEYRLNLDWPTRCKICMGIARGLAYLHEESRLKIVHRDIKATNVLLDKDLNAKISDFGLAKLDEEENTHISTRIAGTIGYMAPEYAMRGYLTDKADVYSFGIVALEIVSGKSNTNYRPKEEFVYLLDWAYVLQEQGNLVELVDPILGSNFSKEEAVRMLNLGLLCANPSPTLRPAMSAVVSMLEGQTPVQAPLVKRASMNEYSRFKAFEKLSQDSQTHISSFSQDSQMQRSMSMDGPWLDSSMSLHSKEGTRDHSSSSKHPLISVNIN